MMISLHRCLKPAWQDASSNLLKSSIMHVRLLSSHPRPKSEPSDESLAEISGGWWRRVKTAMFPVSTMAETKAATEASSKQQKAMALMSPASLERLRRVKEAEERQQNLEASSGDVFTPLSKGAEEFSGNLFKAGMFMISLPLAVSRDPPPITCMMDVHVGYFISKVLLIALCIKGLRSDNHEIIKISLVRIQSFVFNDFMAGRFEQDDGVVMLVSLLGHHDVLADADVMSECLSAISHLMKFYETREALLLGMVTQRLQKAIEKGWVAKEQMEEAKYVCAVLEARQQEDMEATFGRAEGKS